MVEVFQYLKLFARTWLKSIDVITLGFTKHTTNTLWMRIFGSSFVFCCDNSFIYSLIPLSYQQKYAASLNIVANSFQRDRVTSASFVFDCDDSFIYSLIHPVISIKVRYCIKECSRFIRTRPSHQCHTRNSV